MLTCIAAITPATAQETTRVETRVTADASDDPRHPTATGTRLVLEAPFADTRELSERLGDVTGVHPRRTSYGQTAFATIRGSSTRQVHVEWEGLELSPPFGPGFDFGGSTLLGFDEVIVWRGPAATFRGSGAVAGALEFRTRHLQKPGTRFVGSALGGSFGTLAGSADLAVASEDVSTRVAVAGRRSDGAFPFEDDQGDVALRVNNAHARRALFGSSEVRRGRTTIRGTAIVDGGQRGTPGQSEFQNRFTRATLEDDRQVGLLRVERRNAVRLADSPVDGFAVGGVQRKNLVYTNPEPFLGGEPITEDADSLAIAAKTGATGWFERSVIRAEVDGRSESWRDTRVDVMRASAGVGASYEHTIVDGRWLLFGSGRAELVEGVAPQALPAVGSRWTLSDALSLSVNAGRTFRAPDLDELYLRTETLSGNSELEPERAWVGDATISWRAEHVGARVTGFTQQVDEAILFLPVSAYRIEATNIAGTAAYGAEVSGRVEVGKATADAGYTATHATFRGTGDPVPLQPAHRGFLRLAGDASLPDDHPWRVAPDVSVWTRADARSRIHLDTFGNQSARGYVFWDVGVTFGGPSWDFTLHGRNLLDDAGAVDALQQPLPGRSFWASFLWRGDAS